MNYTELTSALQGYLENSDPLFVALIPTFVTQAEQRIYNSVQLPGLVNTTYYTTAVGVNEILLPDTVLNVTGVQVRDGDGIQHYLMQRDLSFLNEAFPDDTPSGVPTDYAVLSPTVLLVAPPPDDEYYTTITYYAYPESITTAVSGTSWLGDNFSSVLLWGSIIEAYLYLKGDAETMAMYDKRYQEALALLKRLGDGLIRRDNYRNPQLRINVP